jgi:hypothetical protein|tara:strand:- start:1330 stop:1728 length:399 start_codon:yes stop_codon:yes gene_type:complete
MDQKDNYTKVFLKAADQPFDTPDIKNKRTLWWYNIRDVGGLRLTEEAIVHIEQIAKIKTYKVDFPKQFKITPKVLLWLDNFIESPYYITKKSITVLKERSAFELYLFSGDISKMGYNKALSKRLSEETADQE